MAVLKIQVMYKDKKGEESNFVFPIVDTYWNRLNHSARKEAIATRIGIERSDIISIKEP